MNGARSSKPRNLEKTFPRCLGRMVNLLDLNTSLAGNRFLTEKPHHDGPPLPVGRSDAARMSPIVDPIEDKEIVSELRRSSSNKKSNLTPMKMLIAQEMSKEVESKRNPPSLVAKLMGLDALPQQQPDSAVEASHSSGYSRSHLGIPLDYWPQEDGLEVHMEREIPRCQLENEYKDVYEIRQESEKGCYVRQPAQKGRHGESINEKKMDLVRQKFTEAKRLSMDEKLLQSKQFHDAVEVLSSNKDFFLKFLQEPNSLFSQHVLVDFQSAPPPPETKRITVLKPSKVVDNNKLSGSGKKDEKQIKRASHVDQLIGWENGSPGFPPPDLRVNGNSTPPTRIVVLKPSLGKPHDIKVVASPPPSSPKVLHRQELYREREDHEIQESGEQAKDTTWPIRENLSGHRRDETLLSSVFSNDYIGDGSFSNISENEFAVGNINEIEVVSPTCRHSWDYINRFGSPCSSSFSRPSYSPESSVSREAKKRLSERWAMIASIRNFQEQRHARRSSSTLGEMLALSETKKSVKPEEEGMNKEQEPNGSKSRSASDLNKDENVDNSPWILLRSKSLPVSSTVFEGRLNVEVPDPEVSKTDAKEVTKQRSVKSSLKGKVSSFFSRNKNSSKEKSNASQSKAESKKSAGMVVNATENNHDEISQCANGCGNEEGSLRILRGSSSKTSLPNVVGTGPKLATISPEARFSLIKPELSGYPCENQDQPSPISILEPPFSEDDCFKSESYNINADKHGAKLTAHSIKSNLIDKSPPIGSIARTLSWEDSCVETATSYQLKPLLVSQEPEIEEPEWLSYIQSLLSAAGLNGEVQCDSFLPRWHSPESLLDPSLRDKYMDLNDEEIIHEAKRRKMISTRKLVFDCVNAALLDISGYGSETSPTSTPPQVFEGASPTLVDQVWDRMKEWFPCEARCFSGVGGDNHSLAAEMAVSKEILGKGWVKQRRLEIDNIGKEIEGRLVEELVQEAVFELIGRVC